MLLATALLSPTSYLPHEPQLSEEVEGVRSSMDVDVPLACKLDVIAGPCSGRAYTNTEDVLEVSTCLASQLCF